jgi:hypothetical protein
VQNGLIEIPISFEVVATSLAGDYNGDGKVDAADYVVWRKRPGDFGGDPDGYDAWRSNYGAALSGSGSSVPNSVPEPAAWLLTALGACLAAATRGRLRG